MRSTALGDAFAAFEAQSNLSANSLKSYRYALQQFCAYLQSSPMAARTSLAAEDALTAELSRLGAAREDVNLLQWFVHYLGREAPNARPRRGKPASDGLEPATVRLYGQAMITFFRFLADELLLPDAFQSASALQKARRLLRTFVPASEARDGAPEPPVGMKELVRAFDGPLDDPEASQEEWERMERERLRNRALLYALADSGARVSEILRLTADQIGAARLNEQRVWQVRVRGKGRGQAGRLVTLRFTEPTLRAMRAYLDLRADPGATALFVSHAKTRPTYRGSDLSANAVWRMIRRTAKSLGLPHIHPHDFRHWRATQMLQEGVPIDQVQRFLNHRSIRTTQLYAKTAEQQVDQAGQRTSPVPNAEAD